MTPLRHRLARAVLLALVAAAGASAALYVASERRLHATTAWPRTQVGAVPLDDATVRDGARLGHVLGCTNCHGPSLTGAPYHDTRLGLDMAAPNLTRLLPGYADDELARAIRDGVARDGRALYGMPARAFRSLADEDLRRIIAWLRRVPARGEPSPPRRVGVGLRARLLLGTAVPDALAADASGPGLPATADMTDRGRYLAHVACGECHGASLDGDGALVPPLTVAVAYTDAAFAHLMRTGETPGGRDLDRMDDTARARFSHFTDEEVASLYAYLRARAGQ